MNMTKIWNILLLAALLSATAAHAENRFFFSQETVLTESSGNAIEVLCDSDELTLGFSYAIRYNPDELEITAVTNEGTAAAEADYFTGRIDQDSGRLGYGCVYDIEGVFDEKHLAAGAGHRLGIITFNALLSQASEPALRFENTSFPPNVRVPVRNILTDGDGRSIVPSLEEGRITVITAAPEITSIEGGSGEAGQVFQVSGQHLDREGLTVQVCGADAEFSLRADGETIDVTAPACENAGCVPVVISTVRGSDEAEDGFCYNTPKPVAVFLRGDADSDLSIELTDAIFVLNYLFISGRTPGCMDAADIDNNSAIDLSDAIYVLNYLFIGGRVPPAPFEECGEDTDEDELACESYPDCP
ncbi:MAG: hypothetical protein VCD16_06980 [Planctomycetota bacterium]